MLKKIIEWIKSLFKRETKIEYIFERFKAPKNDGNIWTEEEEGFIMAVEEKYTDKEIGKKLGRTEAAVRQKRFYLKNGRK